VLSINDALMNETISATHEGKHTVYLFMQTGTGHFIFGGGVEKCAHLIQLERDGGSERTTNTDSLSDCESRVVAKNMFC